MFASDFDKQIQSSIKKNVAISQATFTKAEKVVTKLPAYR